MMDYEECFRDWGWKVGLMENWRSWFLWLEATVGRRGELLGGASGPRGVVPIISSTAHH